MGTGVRSLGRIAVKKESGLTTQGAQGMDGRALTEQEQLAVLREMRVEGDLTDQQWSTVLARRAICATCSENDGLNVLTVHCRNCGCSGLSLLGQRCRLRKWNSAPGTQQVSTSERRKQVVTDDLESLFRSPGLPLVTCVMPTYGRPDYVMESVYLFLQQDYPRKELVILNDCPEQIFDCDIAGIQAINVKRRFGSLGEKRNAAIRQARGRIVAVWDDDDIYLPWRLTFTVEEMRRQKTPIYRSERYWAYWGNGPLHDNRASFEWMNHSLTAFTRELWEQSGRYPHQDVREDRQFLLKSQRLMQTRYHAFPLDDHDRYFILRGLSSYPHMSMGGGTGTLDTSPGRYKVAPRPISDPLLRSHYDRLIQDHMDSRTRGG